MNIDVLNILIIN